MWRLSTASIASLTAILLIPDGLDRTTDSAFQGRQISGSEAPNRTNSGIPKAAAMWAGPLSLPANSDALASRDLICSRFAPVMQRYSENSARLSLGPAMKTGSSPNSRSRWAARERKLVAGQVFAAADATGWRTA